jgi:diguanylate cyclase (GGDEF)-like protein
MTGYRREEVIGRSSSDIDLWVDPVDRESAVARLREEGSLFITTRMRMKDGGVLLVEASLAAFGANDEELLIAVVRDITARDALERELVEHRRHLERLVAQRTAELEEAMRRLEELTVTDELTGAGNRRAFTRRLRARCAESDRTGMPFCMAVLDLDHFKAVNDRYGHAVGDQAIQVFASLALREMRAVDYVARYGGDEFVLLLQDATIEQAIQPVERICRAVAHYPWGSIAPGMELTASIGVTAYRREEGDDAVFRRADQALYEAKRRGRNQALVA